MDIKHRNIRDHLDLVVEEFQLAIHAAKDAGEMGLADELGNLSDEVLDIIEELDFPD